MPTGIVAKKIALFEDSSCRLKRKCAIKRRKQRRGGGRDCLDSQTSEEGSIVDSVTYSRSESDLCSSYGYGLELNSMSSSPSLPDSDHPPLSLIDNSIVDIEKEDGKSVPIDLMSKSTSNYDADSDRTLNSSCTLMNHKKQGKHAHRDSVKRESSLSVDEEEEEEDVSPDLTVSIQEEICTEARSVEIENYYSDDAFPSQNQINLQFPAPITTTTSTCQEEQRRENDVEDEGVGVKLENLTINESSNGRKGTSCVRKKFKFQSIYTFTNNAKKKCLSSKKLFHFGHNFLPSAPPPPHGNSPPSVCTTLNNNNNSNNNLSCGVSSEAIQNPTLLPSRCRSKSLSEIPSVSSSPLPEVVNLNTTTTTHRSSGSKGEKKRVKSKMQLKQILDKIKFMEKEIVPPPPTTTTTNDPNVNDDDEDSEPFYEEVDELQAKCSTVEAVVVGNITSKKSCNYSEDNNQKESSQISTEGILRTGATAGVKSELATQNPTTIKVQVVQTKTMSGMSTSRLKDKGKSDTRNRRRHSIDWTNLSLATGALAVKDDEEPRLGSCPPTPPYESLYSEPIYGQSSSSFKSSISAGVNGGGGGGGGGPSWSTNTDNELNYNGSISSFGQNSSIYSANFYGKSGSNVNLPTPCPPGGIINYGIKTLPPPPTLSSSSGGKGNSPQDLPNRLSSTITKTGRKLAKKLLSIRRVSRTNSFDVEAHHHQVANGNGNGPTDARRVSSPANIQSMSNSLRDNYNQIYTYSSDSFSGSSTSGRSSSVETPGIRRSISRPNVAPPQPPTTTTSSSTSNPIPPTLPPPNPIRGQPPGSRLGSMSRLNDNVKDKGKEEDKPIYSNLVPFTPNPKQTTKTDCNNYLSNNTTTTTTTPNHKSRVDLNFHQSSQDDFDDYEDSDFYDSDSELIRNFVSAVQPIYSMEEEPLYQYYTYGISLKPEDVYQPVIPKNLGLTLDMLVPRVGQRTLWCELPEVMTSGILGILSDKQKQLQEAIFEILTSEVSYLKSLDVLISLFYESHELQAVLSSEEMRFICGNIKQVRDCSQSFLAELLGKWDESWYIQEIGEIVNEYALARFTVYIDYCRNKPHQDRTLNRLRLTNDEFVSVVKSIEENPKCQMLRMDSFLMLPMQRITRLPLLVNAVIQRTHSLKEKGHCEEALKNLTNLVLDCNEAARESQDAEETASIVEKIEFPRGMKSLNAQSLGQFILKGDFMKNPFDQTNSRGGVGGQINWTFRKTKRTFYWLILFSNTLIVARKKSSGKFEAVDMAPTVDSNIKPLPNIDGLSKDFQHYFMLHFNRKETVYFLGARTQSEVERWKKKLESLKVKDLQVEAIFPYDAQREDELSFDVGDVISVSQMQVDGWYFGTKVKSIGSSNGGGGGEDKGWFPGNYCAEL